MLFDAYLCMEGCDCESQLFLMCTFGERMFDELVYDTLVTFKGFMVFLSKLL